MYVRFRDDHESEDNSICLSQFVFVEDPSHYHATQTNCVSHLPSSHHHTTHLEN